MRYSAARVHHGQKCSLVTYHTPITEDPGLSLPRLDTNLDTFWTIWTKMPDFGCEVSGQILAEIF